MVRILAPDSRISVTALLLLFAVCARSAEPGEGNRLSLGIEVGHADTSGYASWTAGSVGKLIDNGSGATFRRGYLDFTSRLSDTVDLHGAVEVYDDDLGPAIGVTQAYLRWRPVPRSATSFRARVGAFYPRISLENVAAGWGSPYSLDFSAINTWVAEELRSVGVEVSLERRLPDRGQSFGLHGSVFAGSDPAGSLLAWKGWSVHHRQTRYGDELPLAELPQTRPGSMFEAQDSYAAPLREVDDRPGYALTADWDYRHRVRVLAGLYDNRADPEALAGGQYGWRTRFRHAGLQAQIAGDVGVIGQVMTGSAKMGFVVGDARAVDVEYDAWFLLLTRRFGHHRVSLRRDRFEISENDAAPDDDNTERGGGWTFSYRYGISKSVDLVVEWLRIRTHRAAWAYLGLEPERTERQLQLILRAHI